MATTKNSAPRSSADEAKVTAMVESIWEHRDELARMAEDLPRLLQEAGLHMREAGEGAQRASVYLAGDVREFAGHAADVLEESKHQLKAVLQALEGAGRMLRNLPLIGDMGKMMGESLGAIGDVADNLDLVGRKVRSLGDRLADVGVDLDAMGASLLGGGSSLSQYGAPPDTKPASPPKKASATKKPAAKKTPAKKTAPAKKTPAKKAATSSTRRTRTP
jgi:hypothetical protein